MSDGAPAPEILSREDFGRDLQDVSELTDGENKAKATRRIRAHDAAQRAALATLRGRIYLAAFELVKHDSAEAYHQLYAAVDPEFSILGDPFEQWREFGDALEQAQQNERTSP